MVMKYTDKTGSGIKRYLKDSSFVCEKKFDGVYCRVTISDKGSINMISRNRKLHYERRFSNIYNIIKAAKLPPDTIFEGELIAQSEKITDIQKLIQRKENIDAIQREINPHFVMFEIIKYGGVDYTKKPWIDRKTLIRTIKNNYFRREKHIIIPDEAVNPKSKLALLRKIKSSGGEGVMFKGITAKYRDCRAGDILKYKLYKEADCYWKGEVEMSASTTNAGLPRNIKLYQINNGSEVYVGDVGSGFEFNERRSLIEKMRGAAKNPVVVTVKYLSRNPETYKLRHPTFVRFRPDKTYNECVAYEK